LVFVVRLTVVVFDTKFCSTLHALSLIRFIFIVIIVFHDKKKIYNYNAREVELIVVHVSINLCQFFLLLYDK